jgi:hypothetical protein
VDWRALRRGAAEATLPFRDASATPSTARARVAEGAARAAVGSTVEQMAADMLCVGPLSRESLWRTRLEEGDPAISTRTLDDVSSETGVPSPRMSTGPF